MAYTDISDGPEMTKRLQAMLRALSKWTADPMLGVAINGRFDEGTKNAVTHFQKKYFLPPTGDVNFDTWDAITDLYKTYESIYGQTEGIYPFPTSHDFIVTPGERSNLVYVLQIMLNELRRSYDSYGHLPLNGRYDLSMTRAIEEFQRAQGVEVNGIVDRSTWNRLADEYNALVRYSE
ncbi:MAG: peptidoglycan-binding protein [Clostridia bacterium]|nr:peptidoglycan-binding protein [Clostridia bacterium]